MKRSLSGLAISLTASAVSSPEHNHSASILSKMGSAAQTSLEKVGKGLRNPNCFSGTFSSVAAMLDDHVLFSKWRVSGK
jgi:hypothetical protein